MKKYLYMLSAAVMIGALRVNKAAVLMRGHNIYFQREIRKKISQNYLQNNVYVLFGALLSGWLCRSVTSLFTHHKPLFLMAWLKF